MSAYAKVKATKPIAIVIGCSYYRLQSDGTYREIPDLAFGLQPAIVLSDTTGATIRGFTVAVTNSGAATQYILTGHTNRKDFYDHIVGRTTVRTQYVRELTITYSTTPRTPRVLDSHAIFGDYGQVSVRAPTANIVSKVTPPPKKIPPSCRTK